MRYSVIDANAIIEQLMGEYNNEENISLWFSGNVVFVYTSI